MLIINNLFKNSVNNYDFSIPFHPLYNFIYDGGLYTLFGLVGAVSHRTAHQHTSTRTRHKTQKSLGNLSTSKASYHK